MSTLKLPQAAERAGCHQETLRRMMKDGEAPGTKIGRAWIVSEELFQQWINNRCLCTDAAVPPSGGSALAARLAARLKQQTAKKPRNSKKSSQNAYGDKTTSKIVVPFRGQKRANDG